MKNDNTIPVYIELLDEGTETWRLTEAMAIGNGLFKILPTPNYDPEDEAWAFLPGDIVRIEQMQFANGKSGKAAMNPDPDVIRIDMPLVNMKPDLRPTSAFGLGNGLYKILPTPRYNPAKEKWMFPPGSVVRLEQKTFPGGTFLIPVEEA